jgi:Zinc finger, C2H2 type.
MASERLKGKKEKEASIRCPYCESMFNTKEELSKHIDKIHIGPGVLEGDTRKL